MKKVLAALGIWCLLAGVVQAIPTMYSDSGSFLANNVVSLLEDFEGVTPKDTALASFTSNGVTYTGTQATNPNVWVASAGYTNFGVPVTMSSVLTATGNEVFTLDLSANPVQAVGFDVYLNGVGPVVTQWYGSGGTLLMTVIDGRAAESVLFLGLGSDVPIYSISWTAVGGERINTGIDNVYVGTVATVPAPGAILLGALGTGLVGWLRRRGSL